MITPRLFTRGGVGKRGRRTINGGREGDLLGTDGRTPKVDQSSGSSIEMIPHNTSDQLFTALSYGQLTTAATITFYVWMFTAESSTINLSAK